MVQTETYGNYLATMFAEEIIVNGLEQLRNFQVPKRGSYIKVMLQIDIRIGFAKYITFQPTIIYPNFTCKSMSWKIAFYFNKKLI